MKKIADFITMLLCLLCANSAFANPYTHFVDVLQRVSVTKASDVADLTPLRWRELFAQKTMRSDLD